jgi:FAD/FMN-containing dehydrogenase
MRISSWGGMTGVVESLSQPAFSSEIRAQVLAPDGQNDSTCLVIGKLRSYGDEVLNQHGRYIKTTRCDRIIEIDQHGGTVTAESGVSLQVLQQRLESFGFILPVTPGTARLTLGGAIANDVHGKNHHVAGTLGCFVDKFELVRSSGEVLQCSPREHADYFGATIGGMGLTGAITQATIRLRRITSPFLSVTSHRFGSLAEFFDLDMRSKDQHEYTVAWIDCLSRGRALGRGIYSVADHLPSGGDRSDPPQRNGAYRASIPFPLPVSPVNRLTLSLMNSAYYRLHRTGQRTIRYDDWLYPLDAIGRWNRLYGRRGFHQFQCVVPYHDARTAITEMLKTIASHGQGSFLAVLKNFGDKPSPGWMSFPMPGATLALDFPNRGAATRELLLDLYRIAAAAGGRLYPAKDGCSPASSLAQGYPNHERFRHLIDPGFGSVMAARLQLIT